MLTTDVKEENVILRERAMSYLTRTNASIEEIVGIVRKLYIADKEDFRDEDIESDVLVWRETNLGVGKGHGKSIQTEVEDWLHSNTSNKACYGDVTCSLLVCYLDLNLKTPSEKASCRMAFKRLVERGKLQPIRNRSGMYRYINGNMNEMDFINIDSTPFSIKYPLNVHEWVSTYRKTLVVLAGEPNSGKTAYLLNLAYKNMNDHKITYFSSEMGPEELQVRLKKFEKPLEEWKRIRFISKSGDFKDVLEPNELTIIDYLECAKDFYEVGGMLTEIFNALDTGVAVVAIQKPKGRDTGIGGERTLDKARLYMAIEPGILKIVKAKLWRQDAVNPNGMFIKWNLVGGAKFSVIRDPGTADNWRRA